MMDVFIPNITIIIIPFVRAELKLASVVPVCTVETLLKIKYQIILALSKGKVSIIGFHSLSDNTDVRLMQKFLIFFLIDNLFYPSHCGKEKTLNISLGIVVVE